MKTGADGRSRIELSDIDLRHGFYAMRWFWLAFAFLFVAWVLA